MAQAFLADDWLSQVSGFRCYRYSGSIAASAAALKAAMEALAGDATAFFYAKVGTACAGDVQRLAQAGFAVVDTNVIFEWPAGRESSVLSNSGVSVARALPVQHAALQDIAARCFRYSRFHLDPLFPGETADRIKREWIGNYCAGHRGTALYVAMVNDEPAGFLAVIETAGAIPGAAIDLVGVAPEHQGHGVGTALVTHFIEQWRPRAGVLRVGTQIANLPSIAFYQSKGFRIVESSYVLHAHCLNGEPSNENCQL